MAFKHHALQMYDYHVWANRKVFGHLKELPPEIWNREIQSVFPSVGELTAHIYLTDAVWFGVIREESFQEIMAYAGPLQEEVKGKSIGELEEMYASLSERYLSFLGSMEDLDRMMATEHPHFGRMEARLSDLVHHVVNHGTHHRGNLSAMLRQIGHPGVSTDYIFYLYTLV